MKSINLYFSIIIFATIALFTACSNDDNSTTTTTGIEPGNDPNFTIVAHTDAGFTATNRKVDVFGIPIYAYAEVADSKLLHAANIMAQYLDNNEDGTIDNQILVDALISNDAALYLWKTDAQSGTINAQDLGNDETIPTWHSNGHTGQFDAAVEEVWHVVTNSGYANAYPTIFGAEAGTSLANAMDIARGGHFTTIPNPFPASAWYTYDDQSCDYGCMTGEYIYWTMSAMLGAQENRLSEIDNEWRLNTPALVQNTDTAAYALISDPQYKFPTVLPDGTYRQ